MVTRSGKVDIALSSGFGQSVFYSLFLPLLRVNYFHLFPFLLFSVFIPVSMNKLSTTPVLGFSGKEFNTTKWRKPKILEFPQGSKVRDSNSEYESIIN